MDATEIPARPNCRGRKSVSFTDETELVDANGSVTVVTASEDNTIPTAQSHKPSTPPLSAALGAFADPMASVATENPLPVAEPVAADEAAPAEDTGLDLSLMKKKKKKVKKVDDDFTAKLKALELDKEGEGEEAEADAAAADDGDMVEGTGVWAHDDTRVFNYDQLAGRFYVLLHQKIPLSLAGVKSKIPPPQCMREGNKKTIFANLSEICKRMKRIEDHVIAYHFVELGTSGSVDGLGRLIIKGKFTQKQIEGVLRNYILEYVTCATCRSLDTDLSKGENRLHFVTCMSCGSRRSVATVKAGFTAQVGRRRK